MSPYTTPMEPRVKAQNEAGAAWACPAGAMAMPASVVAMDGPLSAVVGLGLTWLGWDWFHSNTGMPANAQILPMETSGLLPIPSIDAGAETNAADPALANRSSSSA